MNFSEKTLTKMEMTVANLYFWKNFFKSSRSGQLKSNIILDGFNVKPFALASFFRAVKILK